MSQEGQGAAMGGVHLGPLDIENAQLLNQENRESAPGSCVPSTPFAFKSRAWGFKSNKFPVSGVNEAGEADVHNLYLVATWATLKGKAKSFGTLGIIAISILLSFVQIGVLLNLAWVLNDERMVDLEDTLENYYVETNPDFLSPTKEAIVVAEHKHIISQDDRFCHTDGSGGLGIVFVYYNCIFAESMTTWDLVTLVLLTVALYEKLSDSHLELVYQMVLGIVVLQEPGVSRKRRLAGTLFLSTRCLQEGLFVAVSIVIVAAAKGTLNMILNSLAISFFADLDNMIWERLLILWPKLNDLRDETSRSLNGEDVEVTRRVERGKLDTMRYSVSVSLVYFIWTIVLKNNTIFEYFDNSASQDTNVAIGVFIVPVLAMWIMLVFHCSKMAQETMMARHEAPTSTDDVPVVRSKMHKRWRAMNTHCPSWLICTQVVALSLCFLFLAVGFVEAVIGAGCAWRFSLYYAAFVSVPVLLSHYVLHLRLECREAAHYTSGAAWLVLLAVLYLVAGVFATAVTLSPTLSSYTSDSGSYTQFDCYYEDGSMSWRCLFDEWLMGEQTYHRTFCLCGYNGWSPNIQDLNNHIDYCNSVNSIAAIETYEYISGMPAGGNDDGDDDSSNNPNGQPPEYQSSSTGPGSGPAEGSSEPP